jgi:hypothetical protein
LCEAGAIKAEAHVAAVAHDQYPGACTPSAFSAAFLVRNLKKRQKIRKRDKKLEKESGKYIPVLAPRSQVYT